MLQHFFKAKGETLPETMVSILIITLSVLTATTMLIASLKANNASRERIIAINLAREGIETLHLTRDNNWLHYSREKRVCWNNNPSRGPCEDLDSDEVSDNAIVSGSYRIDFDPTNYSWSLDDSPTADDWNNNRLYLEGGLYTHRALDGGGANNIKTEYSRRVYIEYLDDSGAPGTEADKRMQVSSLVKFTEGGREHYITLITRLTDHHGRSYKDF